MTRRQELEHRRRSLREIREIMRSMKSLAYLEVRKLSRFLGAQHAVVRSLEETAADFLGYYPEAMPRVAETAAVYLLIGTERGFCGDFNQSLLRHLEAALAMHPVDAPHLITVGRKLHALTEEDGRVAAMIPGAGVVEEVTMVLNRMVQALAALQEQHGLAAVYGLYHGGPDGIVVQKLLPSFQPYRRQPPKYPHPPKLNLPPAEFLLALTDHYLFAALYEMLYASLMAENQNRIAHLEGAVKHLDEKSEALARQCNALRQEEIIEEIEVILLSAGSTAHGGFRHKTLHTGQAGEKTPTK